MTQTTFVQGKVIPSSWLNAVDLLTYGLGDAARGSSLLQFLQSGTGASVRTVQTKLRETVSVTDFGAVADWNGTTGTDNLAAFNAAIAALPTSASPANGLSRAGTLIIPGGRYYLSGTLVLQRCVNIVGAGNGAWEYAAGTELVFPKNVTGIRIHSLLESPAGTSAAKSKLSGLYIYCKEKAASGHGIHMSAMAHLENVTVENFKGNGINIVAESPTTGNANGWRMDDVISSGNGGHGLFVDGNDANAGLATRCAFSSNTLNGILDQSGLGNTYVACLTEANVARHAETTRATAYNLFLNCYAEGGPGANQAKFVFPTIVIGNTFANPAWITTDSTALVINNDNLIRRALRYSNSLGSEAVGARLGLDAADTLMGVLAWGAASESAEHDAWKLRWDATNKMWFVQYANNSSYEPLAFPNSAAARNGVGNGIVLPGQYFVGTRAAPILRGFAAAAPVAGAYVVGDIVYNNAPAAGGTIGWVCTAAGSPGTWKTFGTIAV